MTRNLTEKEKKALEKALRLAARNGDTNQIRALLKRGVDINAVHEESGQTALMYAAANGNKEAVELLLKNGANINQDDKKGYSALAWAVANGKTDMVNLLIARGADVNAKTPTNHRILDIVRHKLKNASHREAPEYRKIEQALMNAGAKTRDEASKGFLSGTLLGRWLGLDGDENNQAQNITEEKSAQARPANYNQANRGRG